MTYSKIESKGSSSLFPRMEFIITNRQVGAGHAFSSRLDMTYIHAPHLASPRFACLSFSRWLWNHLPERVPSLIWTLVIFVWPLAPCSFVRSFACFFFFLFMECVRSPRGVEWVISLFILTRFPFSTIKWIGWRRVAPSCNLIYSIAVQRNAAFCLPPNLTLFLALKDSIYFLFIISLTIIRSLR